MLYFLIGMIVLTLLTLFIFIRYDFLKETPNVTIVCEDEEIKNLIEEYLSELPKSLLYVFNSYNGLIRVVSKIDDESDNILYGQYIYKAEDQSIEFKIMDIKTTLKQTVYLQFGFFLDFINEYGTRESNLYSDLTVYERDLYEEVYEVHIDDIKDYAAVTFSLYVRNNDMIKKYFKMSYFWIKVLLIQIKFSVNVDVLKYTIKNRINK